MARCVQIAIARSAEHDIRQSDQSLVCHFQDDSWKRDPREFRWTSDSPPILENCGAGYFPGRDHRFRSAHHRSGLQGRHRAPHRPSARPLTRTITRGNYKKRSHLDLSI
jgi:hypothetical protein